MVQVNLNQPPKFILLYYHAFQFQLGISHYLFSLNLLVIVYKYYDFLKSAAPEQAPHMKHSKFKERRGAYSSKYGKRK